MARVVRLFVAVALLAVFIVTVRAAGDNPVAQAVRDGDAAALRKLIASKADVNAAEKDGSTPLLWASHNSDIEMARLLIAAGARFNSANKYGVTPLLEASRTGDFAMMDLLLKAGADANLAHSEGETPLMAAARTGNVRAVQLLIDRGAVVNAVDGFQQETALMRAAAEGHAEAAGLLLKAGANPDLQARINPLTERKNADHPTGGFTALMWAARNGHEDVVRVLARAGANLNLKNGDGASAAMIATYNDRFDLAAVLADLGADVNDGSLYTAVEMRESTTDQFAFDGSRLRPDNPNKLSALDLIKVFLEHGADPNKTFTGQFHSTSMPNNDRFDNSPFYRAAITADVEALKLLIAHGADLDKTPGTVVTGPAELPDPANLGARGRGNPNAGKTAAMVAIAGGRGPQMTGGPGYIRSGTVPYREPGSRKPEEAFALLIQSGADPNAKGPDGATLLHQVSAAGNLEMIRTLAAAKVKFDEPNKDGLTALDIAEGKRPAGAPARGARGGAAAPPPADGARGGRGGTPPQEVAKLLRELMGLPPAPPAPAAPNPPALEGAEIPAAGGEQ